MNNFEPDWVNQRDWKLTMENVFLIYLTKCILPINSNFYSFNWHQASFLPIEGKESEKCQIGLAWSTCGACAHDDMEQYGLRLCDRNVVHRTSSSHDNKITLDTKVFPSQKSNKSGFYAGVGAIIGCTFRGCGHHGRAPLSLKGSACTWPMLRVLLQPHLPSLKGCVLE